jgi:hypothetical protein
MSIFPYVHVSMYACMYFHTSVSMNPSIHVSKYLCISIHPCIHMYHCIHKSMYQLLHIVLMLWNILIVMCINYKGSDPL